jgi:hypothetical protein
VLLKIHNSDVVNRSHSHNPPGLFRLRKSGLPFNRSPVCSYTPLSLSAFLPTTPATMTSWTPAAESPRCQCDTLSVHVCACWAVLIYRHTNKHTTHAFKLQHAHTHTIPPPPNAPPGLAPTAVETAPPLGAPNAPPLTPLCTHRHISGIFAGKYTNICVDREHVIKFDIKKCLVGCNVANDKSI